MTLPAPFTALQARMDRLVEAQRTKPWSSPKLRRQLAGAQEAVNLLGATLEAAIDVEGDVGFDAEGGVATDALSLGIGVSASAAASLSAGISLGVGVSASFTASIVVALHASISALATLEGNLAEFNAQAEARAGTNGVLPPFVKLDSGPVDSGFRGLSSNVAECQRQAYAQAEARPIEPLTAEIRMHRMGTWHAEISTDDEEPLAGKVSFESDGVTFTGTVVPENSGIDGSRARAKVVGGNGGLSRNVQAHSYTSPTGVKVGTVVRDILQDCGENLSDLADGPTLDQTLPRWHVAEGPASHALTRLADKVGASWRVLRDGTVWFGAELWPEVEPAGTLVDEDWGHGSLQIAPDRPNMVPGVVYQGQRVEHVTHRLGTELRSEVTIADPSGKSVYDKMLAGVRREIDYSRVYPCRVVTQNLDGTLQLLPDDDVMKARGLDKVAILCGLPGFRVKVKNGARCEMYFAAGDPGRPRVNGWELDEEFVESVEYVVNGRAAALARQGDPITFYIVPGAPTPISGVVTPPGANFTGFVTLTSPLVGVIGGGNPKLKA